MTYKAIDKRLAEKLAELQISNDSIIVLKGIPLSIVDTSVESINISDVVSNKLGYFMSIFGRRKFLSYEEFLLLSDFVVSQYKEVIILSNNIYMEQYPVEEYFSDTVRSGLLNHYDESDEGETDSSYIGDIDEYISMFQGLKEYNGSLMGVYCSVAALQSPKIFLVNLFDDKREELIYTAEPADNFIEIIEESDYVDLIKLLFTEPDKIYVRISNYTGDINKLKDHIAIVAHYWKRHTQLFFLQTQELEDVYEQRKEYGDILKKYWGYPSFRYLDV